MSTSSCAACSRARPVGRTLKPMIIAFDAAAREISDSEIAPTAEWTISTFTPSTSIF